MSKDGMSFLHSPESRLLSQSHRIERIIYREIIFTCHRYDSSDPEKDPLVRFKATIAARPPSFFADHVKTLHFEGSSFTVESILPVLEVCTGVTNFGCYATFTKSKQGHYHHGSTAGDDDDGKPGPSKIYEYIQSLALERLFITQDNLAELLQLPNPAPAENGDPRGILRVTHLAITNGWKVPFGRFPRLTHWALMPDTEACVPKVRRVLGKTAASDENAAGGSVDDRADTQQNNQIQCVVAMLNDLRARTTTAAKQLREIVDPRLVQFTLPVSNRKFIEDDLWDLAMEFPDEEMPVSEYLPLHLVE
jgi:hypothetical protein